MNKKRVILYLPETGIYPYIRTLAIIGEAAQQQEHIVYITHCTGQMYRCKMMAMYRLPFSAGQNQRKNLCKICLNRFNKVKEKYGFSTISLEDWLDNNAIKEIDDLFLSNKNHLEKIVYMGFPVGQLTLHDLMLEARCLHVHSENMSGEQLILFEKYLRNTMLTISITHAICQKIKPSLFITYNPYAQSQAVQWGSKINGVIHKGASNSHHLGANFSLVQLDHDMLINRFFTHCQQWHEMKDLPIPKAYVQECWKDAIFRSYEAGSHIFSTPKKGDPSNIFNKLKLDEGKKTVVVFTGSYDEHKGGLICCKIWNDEPDVLEAFSSQIDWLKFLRNFASKRNDVQFVVRIHPREGRGQGSEHLKLLRDEFQEDTKTFQVIWPNDIISSYDLLELADLCLISGSTLGLEAARLGIPVLSFMANLNYPNDDFIEIETDPENYEAKLVKMLKREFSFHELIKAVRYYHWYTFVISLDLSETIPQAIDDDTVWPQAPDNMISVFNDILFDRQSVRSYNIQKWKKELSKDAIEEEADEMRKGIRRFIDRVFYPPMRLRKQNFILHFIDRISAKLIGKKFFQRKMTASVFVDYQLTYVNGINDLDKLIEHSRNNPELRYIIADGLYAILVHLGETTRRLSPMILRLARLHETSIQCSIVSTSSTLVESLL
ncbi:MAG: hypothetical protein HQK54_14415 [Oligoflexales bacterium]|nr:hypothetical protein [Oligoflexales bacterium]